MTPPTKAQVEEIVDALIEDGASQLAVEWLRDLALLSLERGEPVARVVSFHASKVEWLGGHALSLKPSNGDPHPSYIEQGTPLYLTSPRSVEEGMALVPQGYKLVAVKGFDDLIYWLGRCSDKGHLDNCSDLIEPWAAFDYREVLASKDGQQGEFCKPHGVAVHECIECIQDGLDYLAGGKGQA